MSRNLVLQAEKLGKRYRLFSSPLHRLYYLFGWNDRSKSHWALKDLSFQLYRGQCLGVVGDNGAGKSTLLKLLAGTLQASHGTLERVGRVTAILELGAGFHPDFTGRENLLFGGALIGLTQDEMSQLSADVIAFSELGEAIDRPVKTYSSGMVVRLAFALVTAVQPEVLIIDEALAVGDQHFQKKCVQRIESFRKNGCTILFCSHSLYHVRQLCDQVLWLDCGQSVALGETESVLAAYETHARLQDLPKSGPNPDSDTMPIANVRSSQAVPLTPPELSTQAAISQVVVHGLIPATDGQGSGQLSGQDLSMQMTAVNMGTEAPSFGVMLEQYEGVGITSIATHAEGVKPVAVSQTGNQTTWMIGLTFPQLPLHSGQYVLSFYLFDAKGLVVYDEWKHHVHFKWVSPSLTPGLVRLPHQWTQAAAD